MNCIGFTTSGDNIAAMNKTYQLQARAFDLAVNQGTLVIQVTVR